MGYHLRIESNEYASFITTRTRNEQLWFVNNRKLEQDILLRMAIVTERYQAKVYAIAIEGNHIQMPVDFPNLNRSKFMRDFNSGVAKSVIKHVPTYSGGKLWSRRYSQEFVPGEPSVEDRFFYTVLQPVQDGLVDSIFKYPGYNCFDDAVSGKVLEFENVNWKAYQAALKRNKKVSIQDYVEIVKFSYTRLPGYENLSQEEYKASMYKKLYERQNNIVKERRAKGLGFVGADKLKLVKPGANTRNSKKSDINSHRPRVLSVCPKLFAQCIEWYFKIYKWYKEASESYRNGDLSVEFPPNTYKPYIPV